MRIAFVINTMGRGGAEVQVMDLATELIARGHTVAVAVLLPFEDFEERLKAAGVHTFSLGLKRGSVSVAAQRRLLKFVNEFGPDVLHGHMFAANIAARTTAALMRIGSRRRLVVVCTAHTPRESSRRYLAYRATDFLCDRFTFVSREGLELHQRGRALSGRKSSVVPNGVHLDRFRPATSDERARARKELKLGEEFVWLALGSFRDEQKDYTNLLTAFSKIASDHPAARLLIGGEGRLLESKREEARRLGIDAVVDFLGLRADVERLMQAADAYVMASAWEALPIVLLEAAAAGLPIVATSVGANEDVVGGVGELVRPKDPGALADAMDKVMRLDETARRALGERARRRAVERFDLLAVVTQWEEIYSEARATRRPD